MSKAVKVYLMVAGTLLGASVGVRLVCIFFGGGWAWTVALILWASLAITCFVMVEW